MWKLALGLCVALPLCVPPAAAGKADPGTVDSLLAAAADTTLDVERRVRLIKDAVRRDRSGRAMHALARLYTGRGTITGRLDAERWLKRAIRREPENADYLATYAELLWKAHYRQKSYEQARQAVALDPDNVRALYWAGRYAAWSREMTYYTQAEEGVDTTASDASVGRTFSQREYAPLDADAGIDYLSRALTVDPDHRPCRLLLGVIYYEERMYGRLVARMPRVFYDETQEGYLFAGERLLLEPGEYHLAAEAEDRVTNRVGTFRDSLRVRRFGMDTLEVSSLLLARRVVEREEGPFGRERFMVLPNPLKQCWRNGNASFYFEIYNLSRDTFGTTRYRVTYQVRALPEAGAEARPEWTTAVSHTLRGSQAWEPQYLVLDMDGAAPGLRAFRVLVEDLQAGHSAMATTTFRVMW